MNLIGIGVEAVFLRKISNSKLKNIKYSLIWLKVKISNYLCGRLAKIFYELPNSITMNKSLLTLLVTLLAATAAHADVVINATKFPDATFRNYVSTYYDRNGDGVMSNSELAAVTTMDVSGQGINNLVGIEYFTALTSLNCSNNNIQDLTLRELTGLQSLACYNNQLRTLSFYNSVQNLYCAHNNL